MTQVLGYCATLGIEYGAICNGHQLVAFIAVRHDRPPLEGKALVIDGRQSLQDNFPHIWQNLTPWAVRERRLTRTLTIEAEAAIPPKVSSTVFSFHQQRYPSRLQVDLRALVDLLIYDIPLADDMKEQFYADCYCDTSQLTQYTLLSERILKTRYAALFESSTSSNPQTVAVTSPGRLPSDGSNKTTTVDALTKRPIILLGDGGVGKTSFLDNLISVRARDTFNKAIYIMINLGTKGNLVTNIRDFILEEVERQLDKTYKVDIYEKRFVRSIYDLEVQKFRKSIFSAGSRDEKDSEGPTGINEYLKALARNKAEHIKKSISHIAKGRRQQVVIFIDNVDQRKIGDQQEAFLAAQEIASDWSALVYISLRPQTFYASKRSGTLSAYANRVFTISPPPPDVALVKRLTFALRIAEGTVSPETLNQISLNLESITMILRVLLRSIRVNDDIKRFVANITGGNIRALLEIFTTFIGSPNVEFNKIIDIEKRTGKYIIPLHEFTKHALLGEFAHYSSTTSLAVNLFDVYTNDSREHFLSALLIAYLQSPGPHKDADGFVRTRKITEEMQSCKFLPQQIAAHLQKLLRKNLIESEGREGMDLHWSELEGDALSDAYRVTSVGAYHLHGWMGSFSYLDAMSFDTSIFDEQSFQILARVANSFYIGDRLNRTDEFRNYITRQWHESGINVPYFDWKNIERNGAESFVSVRRAVARLENGPKQ
jgi:hypothetical protein